MGHLAFDCSLSHRKGVATWWKDAIEDHLRINASDFVSVDSSHDEVPLTANDPSLKVPNDSVSWMVFFRRRKGKSNPLSQAPPGQVPGFSPPS